MGELPYCFTCMIALVKVDEFPNENFYEFPNGARALFNFFAGHK